jgi:hypothetical protein
MQNKTKWAKKKKKHYKNNKTTVFHTNSKTKRVLALWDPSFFEHCLMHLSLDGLVADQIRAPIVETTSPTTKPPATENPTAMLPVVLHLVELAPETARGGKVRLHAPGRRRGRRRR